MAAKPLSLKREKSRRVSKAQEFTRVAEVLLDIDLPHLDQSFTYGIPGQLEDSVRVGALIRVPFNATELDGVVRSIRAVSQGSFKPITKVLNQHAYSEKAIVYAQEVSKRYGCALLRILNLMPQLRQTDASEFQKANDATLRQFVPESARTITELKALLRRSDGTTLIFAPTEKEVRFLEASLRRELGERVISFDGWKKAKEDAGTERIIIGMRGMIFIQVEHLSRIVIFDEASEHYWDQRAPYWNLRDVSLVRSRLEGISLTFISGAPSLELKRLADSGYLALGKSSKSFLRRRRFSLSPESFHATVRRGLDKGSVLVSVASKNYANALICKRCNEVPKCICGFPLKLVRKESAFCIICGTSESSLRCRSCESLEFLHVGKGIERIQEEFGKTFPNVAIHVVTAEKELTSIPSRSIVISTPGVEPRLAQYAGLVLMDGTARVSRPTLRAEEQVRNHWFRLMALTTADAPIYISLPNAHPVTQSLIANDPYRNLGRAIEERTDAKLPPRYRIIKVKGETVSSLATKLKSEFSDIELSRISKSDELIIRVEVSLAQELISALYTLQKYRSASGKTLLSYEIDPSDI